MRILLFTLCTLLFFQIQAQNESDTTKGDVLKIATVEWLPTIQGCEGLSSNQELRACFNEKLMAHVAKNFIFPEAARKTNVGCKIYVQFIIEKDNSISGVKVVKGAKDAYADGNKKQKSAAKLLDKEAIRVIKGVKMVRPAMQDDDPVRMSFTIPINCKIQ